MITEIKSIFFGTKEKKTIAKNTAWLTVAEIITRLSKLPLIIYATRILGPTGFGQFSFALSFVGIFAVFTDLGLSQIISREISQTKDGEEDFSKLISLKIILTLLILLTILGISFFTVQDELVRRSVMILSVFMVTNSLSEFFYAFFQAKQKMRFEALSRVIQAVTVAILGFALLYLLKDVLSLSFSYMLASIASFIYILIIYSRKRGQLEFLSLKIWKKYLSLAWPLALTGIFAMVYNDIDSVMMGYFGQIKEVGLYNAAYRVINIILLSAVLLNKGITPFTNENYVKSPTKFKRTLKYYIKLSLIIIVPTLLIGFFGAHQIITIIFGNEYRQSVTAFQILIGMVCLTIFSYPFTQALIAANQQRKIFWATLLGAVVNMSLNIILIPRFSLNGAAISTITSVFIVVSIIIYSFFKLRNK